MSVIQTSPARLCISAALVAALALPALARDVDGTGEPSEKRWTSTPVLLQPPDGGAQMQETLIREAIDQENAVAATGWSLIGMERKVVAGDIVHYDLRLRTGPGPHDVIGLHRVVKERRPGRPVRTGLSVFLQHGDGKDFTGVFLPGLLSLSTPDDFGIGVFLARHGMDVWGIDQAWTLVPDDLPDYSFMADWGLDRNIRDLRRAILVARLIRLVTGSGHGKMVLCGYSSGVIPTVGLLNEETQIRAGLRLIDGYISIDMTIKTDYPPRIEDLTNRCAALQSQIDAGHHEYFLPFRLIAGLARCCPDDPSPICSGFTNEQCLLLAVTAPSFNHTFHYFAGTWGGGLPSDFSLTPGDAVLDFLDTAMVYESAPFMLDVAKFVANLEDTPFDDHLGEIQVPVLNVAAAGGFGDLTPYGISLLGSTDVQTLMVSAGFPPLLDLGHIDLFTSPESPELAWEPILAWIVEHADPHPEATSIYTVPEDGPMATAVAPERPRLALERVAPNPARGPFTVDFVLPEHADARVEVLDITGRRMLLRDVGGLGPGRHEIAFDPARSLSPGVYLIRLSQGERTLTRRLAILR